MTVVLEISSRMCWSQSQAITLDTTKWLRLRQSDGHRLDLYEKDKTPVVLNKITYIGY